MDNFGNHMGQLLNMEVVPKETLPVPVANTKPKVEKTDLDTDFETARDNVDTVVELSKRAIEYALDMMEQTQHPRWAEAAALLLKNMSDANKEYLENQKRLSDINRNNGTEPETTVNVDKGIIFNGTAKDLLSMLKQRKDGTERKETVLPG